MHPNEISGIIVDAAIKAHSHLGPSLLESVYHHVLAYELPQRSLSVKSEVDVPVVYKGLVFDRGFDADLIVENLVLIEIKSIKELQDVHKKQVLTYLRLTGLPLGLLINFNVSLLKHRIVRVVNNLDR